ncbi:MAG: very short patch repair endonuclease [Synergistaceae bacterium]|nr:very short patch repair endonuclease [Synergistaceae bacterium]
MRRAPEVTHKIMAAVKSKNTRPEVALRKALWRRGLRFRVHYHGLPGKPDIVFTKVKIAVFCDGDYWHGHNWALRGMKNLEEELARYSEFWANKIRRNIQRDEEVNRQLTTLDWQVLRIWESEINKDIISCALKVKQLIEEKRIR